MYLSNDEIKRFLGTGDPNEAGETLQEFVSKYDPALYENPSCTADMAVFIYDREEAEGGIPAGEMHWKLLLIKRGNHPSIGFWAMPGGFVELGEDTAAAAARELREETGVEDVLPVQVRTFSDPGRDPRTQIVTTLYATALPEDSVRPEAGDDAKDAGIFDIKCTVKPLSVSEIKNEDFRGMFDTADPSKKISPYPEYLRMKAAQDPENIEAERVEITFTEEKKGVVLKTVLIRAVDKSVRPGDVCYILKESEGIAMDHGCVMAYAFEFIKKSFNEN